MKTSKYYLDRAAQMEALAAKATGEKNKEGSLKSAEAYRVLAVTAARMNPQDVPDEQE